MRKVLAVSVLFTSQIALAQTYRGQRPSSLDNSVDRRVQQDALEKWALDKDSGKRAAAAQASEAAMEFYAKAQQFVTLWEQFADELNVKKTFNAKLAKQVAKAFHDLEKSEGWAAGREK